MTTTSARRTVRFVAAVAGVAAAGVALPGTALAATAGQAHDLASPSTAQQSGATDDGLDALQPDSASAYDAQSAAFEMPSVPSDLRASRDDDDDENDYDNFDDDYDSSDDNPVGGSDGSFYSNGDDDDDGEEDSDDYDTDTRYEGDIYPGLYNGTDEDRYEEEEEDGGPRRPTPYFTDGLY